MEYEKIDETARYEEACKKVKQIAEAIKHIKIKYYPNFSKITEVDKQVYDELNTQIAKIAGENGLEGLKTELMGDISDKYDNPKIDEESKTDNIRYINTILKQYYGAIDVGKEFISKGKIQKARGAQKKAEEIMETIKKMGKDYEKIAIHYKREVFAQLFSVKEKTTEMLNWMKDCYGKTNAFQKAEGLKELPIENKERTEEIQVSDELVIT